MVLLFYFAVPASGDFKGCYCTFSGTVAASRLGMVVAAVAVCFFVLADDELCFLAILTEQHRRGRSAILALCAVHIHLQSALPLHLWLAVSSWNRVVCRDFCNSPNSMS